MKAPLTRTQGTLLYVAGWLPLFVLYTVGMRQSSAPNYALAIFYTANYLVPGIVLGALVWRLAGRLPWQRWNAFQIVATEFGLVFSYVALWHVVFYAWIALTAGPKQARDIAAQSFGWQLVFAALICGVHAAVFHIVRVFGELRAKEVATAEAEAARTRAEMLVLRGQLDPHFLFNSLHSITALVREDPLRAEEALLQFAALLRRVLDVKRDSTDEVSLAHELKFIDDYLAIERLRLGERLRTSLDVSPEARACELPAFSVQPLVENALHHAIAPRRDGGHVTIRGAVRGGRLEISVGDDGPGAEPAAVARATGVGLSAIRERLRVRYGANATLATETAPGKGFRVTLSLPAESADNEGDAT